jgi:ribose transport system substrate-binding protein
VVQASASIPLAERCPEEVLVRRHLLTALALSALGGGIFAALAIASARPESTRAPAAAHVTPNLAYVNSQIAKYSALPVFKTPGPAFDASKARGKKIFAIPIFSANPFIRGIDEGAQKVATKYGIKWVEFNNQGQPSQWAAGIGQAIAQHANLIILNGPNPKSVAPQLKQARAKGIAVVETHLIDRGMERVPYVSAYELAPFIAAAHLEADWAIKDTHGKANALILTSNEVNPPLPQAVAAIQNEFAKYCGSGCKTKVINIPNADLATKVQSEVQSALLADPTINYIIPTYDPMVQFVVPAIVAAQAQGKVHIATFNGTPFVLKDMEDADIVRMDVGENMNWIGWATMDIAMRLLTHSHKVEDANALRVFTKANVRQTGVPPVLGKGYGSAYVKGYRRLWSGK